MSNTFFCGTRSWQSVPGKEMPAYPLESHPNGNIIAHQHTFIPCGGKIIPCGNSGNKPGGGKRTCIPSGEIYRCFFLCGNSGNKTKCACFSCVTGNICPTFRVTYIPFLNLPCISAWPHLLVRASATLHDSAKQWDSRATYISWALLYSANLMSSYFRGL